MTTLAYRDGVLAADTGLSKGGSTLAHTTKIGRNTTGDLAGGAGTAVYVAKFRSWFETGEQGSPPEAKEHSDMLDRGVIFRASGTIEIYEPGGTFTLRAPYYALGSGAAEALGAMWAGATAPQAVRAAIELDNSTFGGVDVLRHDTS